MICKYCKNAIHTINAGMICNCIQSPEFGRLVWDGHGCKVETAEEEYTRSENRKCCNGSDKDGLQTEASEVIAGQNNCPEGR